MTGLKMPSYVMKGLSLGLMCKRWTVTHTGSYISIVLPFLFF